MKMINLFRGDELLLVLLILTVNGCGAFSTFMCLVTPDVTVPRAIIHRCRLVGAPQTAVDVLTGFGDADEG